MNDKARETLETYLAEAVPLDSWGQWSSWGSRVATFLEKALGTDAALEFKSLYGEEPFDTFGMQRGHVEGLLALDNGPSSSADQRAKVIETKRVSSVNANTRKIFVVHGHDGEAKETLARFLEKLGLAPVILHEQPNQGRTIIEKFEVSSSDVAFAVVLLTPDDLGRASSEDTELRPRARQNVILELGYFMGRLGRMRVCALHKGGIELPSDLPRRDLHRIRFCRSLEDKAGAGIRRSEATYRPPGSFGHVSAPLVIKLTQDFEYTA